ncbi:MAG TPA: ABC transporter permease [Candidatus Paceibacterota bacterium]|nr:ABC transporter permease [Candidatus Paceibacterota bacterium]
MKISDIIHETNTALSANKVRSGLTILGIVIGISSVIVMLAIGAGAQGNIQSSIQSLGANLVQVTPGAQGGAGFGGVAQGRGTAQTLTLEDVDAILNQVSNVTAVAPETSGRYQVTARGTNTNTSIIGVNASYTDVRNIQVAEGVFISDANNISASRVAVLGPTTQTDLFGEGNSAIGQTVRISGAEYKVIGVTAPKGGSGFQNTDDRIYIPITTAQRYLTGNRYVSTISVQASSANVMTQVAQDVTNVLLVQHRINDPAQADFSILNQEDILSAVGSVTQTFTILLAAVASISLLVGGIGIMNMMLTTVTERTREIGLRKAVGATREEISQQFLAEAIVLTLIGGLIGVGLGFAVAYGVTKFGIVQANVSMMSVLLAFGVSAVIGIVFGYYPARRAARLSPIEALRYE